MDIQWTQILFQIINFGVVVGALTYLLYKPILKIFDERAKRIEEGQKAAEEAIEKRENLEKMRDEMQTELKKERAEIIEQAGQEAAERKQEILAEAKEQGQQEVEKMRSAWNEEKSQLIKNTRQEMVEAVVAATKAVIGEKLDSKTDQQLIDKELNKLLEQI